MMRVFIILLICISFSVITHTQNNDATAQVLSFKGESNNSSELDKDLQVNFSSSKDSYLLGETQTIQENEFSKLKLTISTDKKEYFLLEPIPITFDLLNPTSSTIIGHPFFSLNGKKTALLIRKDNGEEEIFGGFSPIPRQIGIVPRPIKAGETHHVEELLNYRLSEMFPTPGEYQIQAIFSNVDSREKAFSNTVTIEILAPESLNKEAYDFINQSSNAKMFYNGGVNLKEEEKIWKRFLSKYGETVYADYVTFKLGEHFFYTGKPQEAETLFQKLSDKSKFVFSEKVKDYLKQIKGSN